MLDDQQRSIYINPVRTQDAAKKTYQERWMIGIDSEKVSGNSMLSVWRDDDDYDNNIYIVIIIISGRLISNFTQCFICWLIHSYVLAFIQFIM